MIDTVIRNPIQIHGVDGCNYVLLHAAERARRVKLLQ